MGCNVAPQPYSTKLTVRLVRTMCCNAAPQSTDIYRLLLYLPKTYAAQTVIWVPIAEMNHTPTHPRRTELAIPAPRLLVGSLLLLAFVAAFCGIAIDDLAHAHHTPAISLIASVVWLLCIALTIVVAVR